MNSESAPPRPSESVHGLVAQAKDYRAAVAACGEGYDAPDVAAATAFKGRLYRTSVRTAPPPFDAGAAAPFAVLRAVAGRPRDAGPLRVLDFGGGAGVHHHLVRAVLPDVAVRWAVVELPRLVAACRGDAGDTLGFFPAIASALAWLGGTADLAFASGSVQYAAEPEAVLAELAAVGAPWLMLARLPLLAGQRVVAVQQASLAACGVGPLPPGVPDRVVRFPVTLMDEAAVPAALSPAYRSEARFVSVSGGFPDASVGAVAWIWALA